MEEFNLLLDEKNEKILSKLDNCVGLSKCKETLREIIKCHEMTQKYKCNIDFENYNIIIRNESAYNSYEKLIKVIAEIYYENKIIRNPNELYISKDELRVNRLEKKDWKSVEEGIIVVDLADFGVYSNDLRKPIIQMIDANPTKSFVIIEDNFIEGKTNAQYIDYFIWSMKIEHISNEEKELYVEKFMKNNSLQYSENVLKK